ncbi:MAG: hypothetical protein AAF790_11155 [Planctomycetota bacterium]
MPTLRKSLVAVGLLAAVAIVFQLVQIGQVNAGAQPVICCCGLDCGCETCDCDGQSCANCSCTTCDCDACECSGACGTAADAADKAVDGADCCESNTCCDDGDCCTVNACCDKSA